MYSKPLIADAEHYQLKSGDHSQLWITGRSREGNEITINITQPDMLLEFAKALKEAQERSNES